jgi:hypothetical protein
MPQEKALALLPELRSADKIEAAVAQILAAIDRKEAILTGYPIIYILDGERGVTETIEEKRYPTEFEPPQSQRNSEQPSPSAPNPVPTTTIDPALPTAFETRNLGVTLEVEPRVLEGGRSIRLSVLPQWVALLKFESYDSVKDKHGRVMRIDQPQFFTTKSNAQLVVQNGQRILLGVHKVPQPENHLQLFILQATATPTKVK